MRKKNFVFKKQILLHFTTANLFPSQESRQSSLLPCLSCSRALSLPSHDQRVSYLYAIGATLTLSAHWYSFCPLAIALVPAHLRLFTTLRLVRKRASVCVLARGGYHCLCFIRRAEASTSNSVLASETCALNESRWFCPDILRPFIRWSSLARKKAVINIINQRLLSVRHCCFELYSCIQIWTKHLYCSVRAVFINNHNLLTEGTRTVWIR